MKILLVACALAGILVGHYKYKNWHNPFCIFNLLWLVVGMMLVRGSEFVYEPSSLAMKIVILGVFAFNLSIFMPRLCIGRKYRNGGEHHLETEYKIIYSSLQVVSWLVLALSIVSALSAIQSVLSGTSFTDIRTEYYTYLSGESVWMYYLRNYFISPMRYVLIITSVIAFFDGARTKTLYVNTVVVVILQAITSGGRYVLMNALFMIVCGGCLYRVKDRLNRKQKAATVIVILALAWGIIYLTNDRSTYLTQDMTTWERMMTTVYQYFAGSVTYLGEVLEKYSFIEGSTYGINFFAGLISPFFVVLTFLHILSYPQIFNVIGTYACQQLQIGPHTFYNAMPTIFGYFYIDGGFILTFVEAVAFGYICKRLYENARRGNLLFIAYYILIIVQICNASTRWFIYSSDYVLAFFYLMLFIRKRPVLEDYQ